MPHVDIPGPDACRRLAAVRAEACVSILDAGYAATAARAASSIRSPRRR